MTARPTHDGRNVITNRPAIRALVIVSLLAAIALAPGLVAFPAAAANATVTVNAAVTQGAFPTELDTQIIYPNILEDVPSGQARLNQYAPPRVRIILGTDGAYVTPDHFHYPTLPAGWSLTDRPGTCTAPFGYQYNDHCWDFTSLDLMISDIYAAGAVPAIDIGYMPDWLWNCSITGTPTPIANGWSLFGDYAARLVSYYNAGSFTAEDGHVITNPEGTSHRVPTWELWNEPNFQTLSCLGPTGSGGGLPGISVAQYLAMWNAVAPKMKAADATILLGGPATTDGVTGFSPDYLQLVMTSGTPKPDIATFHGYGSYDETDKDRCLFDGYASGSGCAADGIHGLTSGLTQVQAWAPGKPTWVTEINVLASYGNDPKQRNWNALGAAWKASAFIQLSKLGASGLFHYSFIHPNGDQFSVIDINTGARLLPFWVEYYLARDFPPGSTFLSATSSVTGVDTLAVRLPSGQVDVLVANRQVASATDSGGPGVAATVQVNVSGIATVTSLTLRQLDNSTPLATGPGAALTPASSATLTFAGYGAAILEFVPSGTTTPTPTPTATSSASPPPTITSVTPSSGSSAGGTTVTIAGSNFRAGVVALFGGSPLNITSQTSTQIVGMTTAHGAATVNVVVTNADATTATCGSCFTYTTATPSPTPSGSGTPTPTPSGPPAPTPPGPTTPSTSSAYLPNLTKTLGGAGGWDTPFIIQNVGSTPTDVQLSFYRFSDGALITQRWVRGLAAGASYADIPLIDAALPNDTQFSLVVQSFGSRVVAIVNQAQGSDATLQAASYDAAPGGSTSVFLPNVTRRFYGYDTPFIVQNLGSAMTLVQAAFTSFDGTQHMSFFMAIQPGRSGVIDPDFTNGLVDGTQYAVVLTADQPIAAVVNAHNESGSPVAYTTTGITAGSQILYGPYAVKSADPNGLNSPIVIQNMDVGPVKASVRFTPLGGGPVQSFDLTQIAPGASAVFDPRFYLGTTAPCVSASSSCLGLGSFSLQIVATGPVAAVVIPTSAHTADAYAASAFPGGRAFLPNVTRTLGGPSGWTTPIYLQSVTAMSATLHWYRFADGALATVQSVSLPLGGATMIDPRTVPGLVDDTQYSVVVDGDGAGTVTAIVYETLFVAGDGVMIYSGFSD